MQVASWLLALFRAVGCRDPYTLQGLESQQLRELGRDGEGTGKEEKEEGQSAAQEQQGGVLVGGRKEGNSWVVVVMVVEVCGVLYFLRKDATHCLPGNKTGM